MTEWESPARKIIQHPWGFLKQVVSGFNANQGILLSGAVAYYTLLSIIPLFSLIVIELSHVIEQEQLIDIVTQYLNIVIPGQAPVFIDQISQFTSQTHIGWLLLVILLFFSSMTFTVLEKAMSIIFHHRVSIHRRHYLISAVLPYGYILILGLGILLITFISGIIQVWEGESVSLFYWNWKLSGLTRFSLYVLGVMGLILMLTSIYMVMPVGKLSFKHALVGSISATILWEIARHILVWYFSTLSMVNMVYGSLATSIAILLFLEVGAIILLFGAQVIAEYERIGYGGRCEDCGELITQETDNRL